MVGPTVAQLAVELADSMDYSPAACLGATKAAMMAESLAVYLVYQKDVTTVEWMGDR
jgi:hypothetical protein